MAHRVVVDHDRRRVTIYTQDGIHVMFKGISMMFYLRPCTNLGGTRN